ncbi:hypothetical protein FA15DRAFT_671260 [Coprinopsis marcescibilis]|uniref:GST N-terminal domain-containing protein n=1 Tax=Coprinopsis marcescibilis TaxID=230819 RepID=A0A5C3KRC9_COPMA|nr:hypothetical protein FA15DRAFT_671260 [Coprinopsis marcescibilis]
MITFYDISNNLRSPLPPSPYCWRTRLCLNYKQVKFSTEYVPYSNIATFAKEKGIPPTAVQPDGSPKYTLPAIYDSDKGTYISDSFKIAQYLDEKYPDTPRLVPEKTAALQAAWEAIYNPIHMKLVPLNVVKVLETLDPVSFEFAKKHVEGLFGRSWEAIVQAAEPDQAGWKDVEKDVALWLQYLDIRNATDRKGVWVIGSEFSFADSVIGGVFFSTKALWGEQSEQWKLVKNWSGGRWVEYIDSMEKYTAVV